jgi:hypothetical protein
MDIEQIGDGEPRAIDEKDYAYGLELQVRW